MNGEQKPLIFVSYSHRDDEAKAFIDRHLGVLRMAGEIEVWSDDEIVVGDDWFQEIETNLERCAVAVLLISTDFLGSEFCIKKEVPVLLERRKREGMMIAPILLRPCAWQIFPWLAAIQMQPSLDTPLLTLEELVQEQELTKVVIAIHSFLATDAQTVTEAKTDTPFPALPNSAIDLTRLPTSGFDVVGRDKELQFLNEAFGGDTLNIVSLRAWGGVGKSTLVNKWCEYLAADNYRGARRTFAWSFYSQGTNERVTSADAFIDEVLRFFGDKDPTAGSPWAKGERLAELVGKEKALLILDGMEPLQDEHQGIKDPALARLVECLAEKNAGLCVIATREPVKEFADFPETTHEVDLEQLSKEAGRALLRIKGLRAADDLLEQASEAFGNHALALNLLASYLKRFAGGDVSQALTIPNLPNVTVDAGKHPRRVMAAFVEKFGEGSELDLLHVMGLFDRPADAGCIAALRKEPVIPGLTERLSTLDEFGWLDLLGKLRDFGLLAESSHYAQDDLDAHPLMREHFGERLRRERKETWKAGHDRLFQHLRELPLKHQPDTLEEMAPLFRAIFHGCIAKQDNAAWQIYLKRIHHRQEREYLVHRLGAPGAELGVIACFFEKPWSRPSTNLNRSAVTSLFSRSGFLLRPLGRIQEAAGNMQVALEVLVEQEEWKRAASVASHLCELTWTLGGIEQATATGKNSVIYADHSGDTYERMICRCRLGNALHQVGDFAAALDQFQEAEAIQVASESGDSKLYSLSGYYYCDLLLSLGRSREVQERAVYAFDLERGLSLFEALDQLSLSAAVLSLGDDRQAKLRLDQAVYRLRAASRVDHLPRCLLARAAYFREAGAYTLSRKDLAEVMRLATRCGMRLFECDAHLEYARLALAEGNPDAALPHFQSAAALVSACGYHRRDPEIAELKTALNS